MKQERSLARRRLQRLGYAMQHRDRWLHRFTAFESGIPSAADADCLSYLFLRYGTASTRIQTFVATEPRCGRVDPTA
jgi:hypothetical protein